MNRRNFLKGIMAVPVLLVAPIPVRAEPLPTTLLGHPIRYVSFIGDEFAPDTAHAHYLDNWAKSYGVRRKPGETDTALRSRVVGRVTDGFK